MIAGWLPVGDFLGADVHFSFFGALTSWLAWVSLIFGFAGILLAYAIYGRKLLSAESIGKSLGPIYTLLIRKYFIDELYERIFLMRFLVDGVFVVLGWIDAHIVDGAVNGVAMVTMTGGKVMRRLETGQLQVYGLAIFVGILAIVAFLFMFN